MNLKQFLKPDWRKIVVFVVLAILTFGSKIISDMYTKVCACYEIGGCVCEPRSIVGIISDASYIILFLPIAFVDLNVHYLIQGGLGEVLNFLSFWIYIKLIIGGIWLYLISCLIIWIYEKFKKVKKK